MPFGDVMAGLLGGDADDSGDEVGVERVMRGGLFWLAGAALALSILMVGCGGGGGETESAPTWTVMVYLDGDNNLEEAALADFQEMEAATPGLEMKIIVLFDRSRSHSRVQENWTETRLYEILPDSNPAAIASKRLTDPTWLGLSGTEGDELNMGSGETLKHFVAFCKAAYPADHTALILWDHGSGWAPAATDRATSQTKFIAIDDESSGDALSIPEIAAALAGQTVDLLGFDACLMAEAEVAWELRDSARFVVASEDLEPSSGWDYTAFLTQFAGLAGPKKTPEALARCIADAYMGGIGGATDRTLSVVDLAALAPLGAAVDLLASEMTALGPDAVTTARYQAFSFNENTCVDLRQFAEKLGASSATRAALDAALSQAVVVNKTTSPDLNCGLSIYFPLFGVSSGEYAHYTSENLTFVAETQWAQALETYQRTALFYTVETVAGTPGLDTQLDLYTEGLVLIAENDDKASGDPFSRLTFPVARGERYLFRVSKNGGVFVPTSDGSYGVGVGATVSGGSVVPVGEAEDPFEAGSGDDSWQLATAVVPDAPLAVHTLTRGDEDWFRFMAP